MMQCRNIREACLAFCRMNIKINEIRANLSKNNSSLSDAMTTVQTGRKFNSRPIIIFWYFTPEMAKTQEEIKIFCLHFPAISAMI